MFIMPCCAAFWRVAQGPTRRNILASLVFAILSCHSSYQNSYLLLAIGVAGAGVCAMCRLWRRSLLILAICCAAAVTLLVYVPTIREFRESCLVMSLAPELTDYFVKSLATALTAEIADSYALRIAGYCLGVAALICLIVPLLRRRPWVGATPSLPAYFLTVAVVAVAANFGFVLAHGIRPFPWHFTPLVVLIGVVVEVALQSKDNNVWVWLGRAAVACLMIALSLPLLWQRAYLRRTNLDRVAAVLAESAKPDDFILVNPFWLATGFKYHYHGDAPWNTQPLTSTDTATCLLPYGTIRQVMATPDSLAPTLQQVEKTLAAGHRLWIVGDIEFQPLDKKLPPLPPAPQSKHGWNCIYYYKVWMWQMGHYLQRHAGSVESVPVPLDQEVSPLETVPLCVFDGWRVGDSIIGAPPGDVPNAGRSTEEQP